MSTTEEREDQIHFDVLDHNIAAGYVTYIVELWLGSRTDPATEITRYIGVWEDDQLEKPDGEAFDPDWSRAMSGRYSATPEPRPKIWEVLEEVKKGDRDAIHYQSQQESLKASAEGTGYSYGRQKLRAELYIKFLDAIDRLVTDPDDQEAWAAVDAYRTWEMEENEEKVRL